MRYIFSTKLIVKESLPVLFCVITYKNTTWNQKIVLGLEALNSLSHVAAETLQIDFFWDFIVIIFKNKISEQPCAKIT